MGSGGNLSLAGQVAESHGMLRLHRSFLLEGRALLALEGPRPPCPSSSRRPPRREFRWVVEMVEVTGRLEGARKYEDEAEPLTGIIVRATGGDGRPLLFVGVQTGQEAGRWGTYSEFLFDSRLEQDPDPLLVGFRRFRFDWGSTTSWEWPVLFLASCAVACLIAVPASILPIKAAKRRSEARYRASTQNFLAMAYSGSSTSSGLPPRPQG